MAARKPAATKTAKPVVKAEAPAEVTVEAPAEVTVNTPNSMAPDKPVEAPKEGNPSERGEPDMMMGSVKRYDS